MDQERYADWLIEKALKDGTVDTGVSHGRSLPPMNRDPLWWVKSFLDRESIPERFEGISTLVDGLLDMAIKEPDLGTARDLLARRNEAVTAWNSEVAEEFELEFIEETDLLSRRAEASGG
jgi:hypothetical protein